MSVRVLLSPAVLAAVLAGAACLPVSGLKADTVVRPVPGAALADPDFGIETRDGFALRREVQMLQWVPGAEGGGDRLGWRDAAVADGGLEAGHRNPDALPVAPMLWRTAARMPDGSELAPALLLSSGEWRLLSPDAAALPPNLAATFQRSGDVLTTAADPGHPQAGDLRLRWSVLVLPPGAGFVAGADGWVATHAAQDTRPAASGDAAPDAGRWRYWLAAIVVLALVAGLAARGRAR